MSAVQVSLLLSLKFFVSSKGTLIRSWEWKHCRIRYVWCNWCMILTCRNRCHCLSISVSGYSLKKESVNYQSAIVSKAYSAQAKRKQSGQEKVRITESYLWAKQCLIVQKGHRFTSSFKIELKICLTSQYFWNYYWLSALIFKNTLTELTRLINPSMTSFNILLCGLIFLFDIYIFAKNIFVQYNLNKLNCG